MTYIGGMESAGLIERLDVMRWNRFHTRAAAVLGLGWGIDAFEVTLIGSILGVLGALWHLSGFALSAILGAWFAGIMLGALGFGALADRCGRRSVFLASLALYGAVTCATAFAPDLGVLLVLRFVAGVGVGAEYSAVNAAIAELMPRARRGFAASFVMNFWSVGTLAAALLAWAVFAVLPADFGWRVVFGAGGLVALASFWFRRRLPESPRWLLAQGRAAEAAAVVEAIAQGVSRVPPARRAPVPPSGRIDGLDHSKNRIASGPRPDGGGAGKFAGFLRFLRTQKLPLALGCVLDFAEAGGYYGLFAFLPLAVLPRLHLAAAALPPFYIAGSFGALLGGVGVSLLLDRLGRKLVVSFCYGATAVACLLFAQIATDGTGAIVAGFVLVNLLATASWVGAYPTFSELFPTALRGSGIGMSVAVGRIGAVISPFLIAYAGKFSLAAALAVLAGFWAIGFFSMLVWCFAGIEARGLSLEQISEPA
jgi:MFS family permease